MLKQNIQGKILKALFVSSGNSESGISPIVFNQGESLKNCEVSLEYFTIRGKGLKGYIKNIKPLKKILKEDRFDIVHSHYSLSSFTTALAGAKNQVVSLMGSDVNAGFIFRILIKIFNFFFWTRCIVKSEDMKRKAGIRNAEVLPNGVDLERFRPLSGSGCLKKLGWDKKKKHILFPADPGRREKNYVLAEKAFEILQNKRGIGLHYLKNIDHAETPLFFNAADMVLLTSLWEGSPNVVKEAMACNCPVVATDVGDIAWLFGNEPGYFLTSFDQADVAEKIQMALEFTLKHGRTNGRDRILALGLDAESIAKRIKEVYLQVFS